MRVFVAGSSGTIGIPLVRALVAEGHQVVAMTRSAGKQPMLRALGATPVVVDAFDSDALRSIVADARPTHVINQLTALPKGGAKRPSDLAATNRLREVGTRNLLSASIAAGALRFICGSFASYAGVDDIPQLHDGVTALKSMEAQVIEASGGHLIGGVVLRYGVFYGAGTPLTDDLVARARRGRLFAIRHDPGRLPFIHIDDAVMATVMALDRGRPGATLDVVDDQPVSFSEVAAVAAADAVPDTLRDASPGVVERRRPE